MTSPSPTSEFARFAGDIAESFGFNRSVGQLYGLLYITQEPMSLEDIARRLGMSKGNASINLRLLESWSAVQPVSVNGSRRDHYEANRNLKEIAGRRLEEGLTRRLAMIHSRLDQLSASTEGTPEGRYLQERLKELRALAVTVRKGLQLLPEIGKFLR